MNFSPTDQSGKYQIFKSSDFLDGIRRRLIVKNLLPYIFRTSCCHSEIESLTSPHFSEKVIQFQRTCEHGDVLLVCGAINEEIGQEVKEVFSRMLFPRWVVAIGNCPLSGGPFNPYNSHRPLSEFIPVDVAIIGCPPSASDIEKGLEKLKGHILGGAPYRDLGANEAEEFSV